MKELVVGIDLGTTNSEIALYENGQVQVIPVDGEKIVPSYVGLSPDDRLLVGTPAKNQYILYPERTIKSIKRKMGTSDKVKLGKDEFTPQEISAMILRHLKQQAEKSLGKDIRKAVITVPAHFSDAQRQATREAGDIAGLEVLRIINEPTAASLAYEMDHEERQIILVYDLGGGTFDVSIVQIQKGVIEVMSSHGDNKLGGDDFDWKILQTLLDIFRKENDVDISEDRTALNRLLHAAEDAKKKLSVDPFVNIREDNLANKKGRPLHLDFELSRLQFEDLIGEYLDKTLDAVHNALEDAGQKPSDIDQVLLVGGSTRIPAVTRLLSDFTGIVPRQDIHPDLCVALGSSILASREMGIEKQKILVDVTPYTFGINSVTMRYGFPHFDYFSPVILRNTPLPTTHTEVFYTMLDFQEAVEIKVFQGEHEECLQNTLIGRFLVEGLSSVPAGNEILVQMKLDIDGILHVSATEKATGLSKKITIKDAFTQMDKEERKKARMHLDKMFRQDWLKVHERASSEKPVSLPDEKSLTSEKGKTAAAQALVEKAETHIDKMHPDDRAEVQELKKSINDAISRKDWNQLDEALESLADLMFFIDEED